MSRRPGDTAREKPRSGSSFEQVAANVNFSRFEDEGVLFATGEQGRRAWPLHGDDTGVAKGFDSRRSRWSSRCAAATVVTVPGILANSAAITRRNTPRAEEGMSMKRLATALAAARA
jgi:hypothetical protein